MSQAFVLKGAIENVYTRGDVPGKVIVASHGLVFVVSTDVSRDVTEEIPEIFSRLLQVARERGGNAVVNARIATGPFDEPKLKWGTSYLIVYGDAVTVR